MHVLGSRLVTTHLSSTSLVYTYRTLVFTVAALNNCWQIPYTSGQLVPVSPDEPLQTHGSLEKKKTWLPDGSQESKVRA